MEVHPPETAGSAAVAGDQHLETEAHGGQLGLVGAPGRLRALTAGVEKAGPATEDDQVLRGIADAPPDRQKMILPMPEEGFDLGQLGLGQIVAIGVTGSLCAEQIAAIHLGAADAAPVKKRIVAAPLMLLQADPPPAR